MQTEELQKMLAQIEVKLKQVEAKAKEQTDAVQEGVDELRGRLQTGEHERKRTGEKVENMAAELKHLKEEVITLKDVIRRQVEEQHLDLKEEFGQFTIQIDTFMNELSLNKSVTQQ